ncbi:hypothetical protein CHLNCDRAFT_55812, partial [Chlorella variabilis]
FAAEALEQFDSQLAEVVVPDTEWEAGPARAGLERDIAAHTHAARLEHVGQALEAAQKAARRDVTAAAIPLLESPPADLWPRLSKVVSKAAAKACAALDAAVEGYGLRVEEVEEVHAAAAAAARAQLLVHAHEAANTALSRVKDRFNEVFQRDEHGMPRTWQPSVDVTAVTAAGRRAAAHLLAQLCFVRDGRGGGGGAGPAAAEAAVLRLADDAAGGGGAAGGGLAGRRGGAAEASTFDLLSAAEWPGVGEEDVLLSPAQARATWRSFMSDSTFSVQQALATQEANRAAQNRLPPLWALLAMAVLGFNEMMAVLYNPLWLLALLILFLFARTVYQEMDVEAEMARGLLPGTIALSSKFVPAIKKVAAQTIDSAKTFLQDAPEGGAAGAGGEAGGVHRRLAGDADGAAAGLRSRRREVELTESSRDASASQFFDADSAAGSRKDD